MDGKVSTPTSTEAAEIVADLMAMDGPSDPEQAEQIAGKETRLQAWRGTLPPVDRDLGPSDNC
ncbi:MAG: hypothetical protein ACR2QA_16835 [Solirubrobacteraceae bacterium]